MNNTPAPGDRVRLTDYAAKGLNARIRSGHLDWSARQGTVQYISRTGVRVVWDGRKSPDVHPPTTLVVLNA